jgi:hypothetical protein
VWIPTKGLADVASITEESIKGALTQNFNVITTGGFDTVLRLRTANHYNDAST